MPKKKFASPTECLQHLSAELEKEGKHYPSTIRELMLPGINSYQDLKASISTGSVLMYREPVASRSAIVEIVAPNLWINMAISYFVMLAMPILGVILSFTTSWWYSILLIAFPIGAKMLRNGYTRSVIHAALRSEIEFCFLFSAGVVRLMTPSGDPIQ